MQMHDLLSYPTRDGLHLACLLFVNFGEMELIRVCASSADAHKPSFLKSILESYEKMK